MGNARIAVLNWLFARHHRGAFVLRIEDTDRERTVPGAEAEILEDLRWLGLEWDEGPGVEDGGPLGPYRQSERLALYREHAQRLLAAGRAFRCYCAEQELRAQREAALARREQPRYSGACRELSAGEAARREREGRRPAIRFRVDEAGSVVVEDAVRGRVQFPASEIGDFILLRSDGVPTYNFAVVVDDALMQITHVIRGSGHLSNTPRQLLLYDALGYAAPVFAHVPMVLGPDRQKLSKRHGARAVSEYRQQGYHPDALVNYLSLLSWSSPSGDELLERGRLVTEVSLARMGVADVVFDAEKLRWLSGKHIERMPLEALVDATSAYVDRERFPLSDAALAVAVAAVRSHLSTLSEINDHLEPFLGTLDAAAERARDALRSEERAQAVLRAARHTLGTLPSWEEAQLEAAVRAAGEMAEARARSLYEPLRIALTGRPYGPPLVAVLFVLGRATALRLLDEALG